MNGNRNRGRLLACARALLLAIPLSSVTIVTAAHAQRALIEPEGWTGWTRREAVTASSFIISTASAPATEAGREILRAGGSAVDAAIAAQLVLGLTEPQSSGIGGGAFILHWDAAQKSLRTYDGRETAPSAARPDRFLRDGAPMDFMTAVKSGLSVGVPGVVKLLAHAHKAHGKLPWPKLFEPAIRLATEGFSVTPRLSMLLGLSGRATFDATARAYFFDETGSPRPTGHLLKNPAYAETLAAIAERGAAAFYEGPLADAMVAAIANAPNAAGDLTASDLAAYEVVEREPLCFAYRKRRICSMGPPSSGGIAIAQILSLAEPFDLGMAPSDAMQPAAIHTLAEAMKLAYADRNRYLADPAFVSIPRGLTDPAYLAERRTLMKPGEPMAPPRPGEPQQAALDHFGQDFTIERAGTSHISIIDADGNAVSMTTTIEGGFGAGLMAGGFLLNNELTDFSMRPVDDAGRAIANRVEPGKRPRSTMTPTIMFGEDGRVEAVLGSPGGGRIIYYVTKAIVALVDWQLDAQRAASIMNFGSMGGAVDLEPDWLTVPTALRLRAMGHTVKTDLMTSGLNIIVRRHNGLEGGTDPRREGLAAGD
ncbi:MAG: gamma-glutamyltransferase [Hyphomicrobium sp.]|nr:gamma-glutamyltransferase [Hyphomicrobium sp.]